MRTFPTWKTVTLGTFPNHRSLLAALRKGGYLLIIQEDDDGEIHRPARTIAEARKNSTIVELVERTPLASTPVEVGLVRATLSELGIDGRKDPKRSWCLLSGPFLADVLRRAEAHGLGICRAEVGPQLRLQYSDQPQGGPPFGEMVRIGMRSIRLSGGCQPEVFEVYHDVTGRWIGGGEDKYDFPITTDFWIFEQLRAP